MTKHQLTEGEKQIKSALGDQLYKLYSAVGTGKPQPQPLASLRTFLTQNPAVFDELELAHSLALGSLFTGMAEGGGSREVFLAEAKTLREKLGAAQAAPLEKLLIEQVVICWLRHQLMELAYSQTMNDGRLAQQEAVTKMLSASQRRYLRAIETLARIRKLGPAVFQVIQVNVANTQTVVGNAVAQVAGE